MHFTMRMINQVKFLGSQLCISAVSVTDSKKSIIRRYPLVGG